MQEARDAEALLMPEEEGDAAEDEQVESSHPLPPGRELRSAARCQEDCLHTATRPPHSHRRFATSFMGAVS